MADHFVGKHTPFEIAHSLADLISAMIAPSAPVENPADSTCRSIIARCLIADAVASVDMLGIGIVGEFPGGVDYSAPLSRRFLER